MVCRRQFQTILASNELCRKQFSDKLFWPKCGAYLMVAFNWGGAYSSKKNNCHINMMMQTAMTKPL